MLVILLVVEIVVLEVLAEIVAEMVGDNAKIIKVLATANTMSAVVAVRTLFKFNAGNVSGLSETVIDKSKSVNAFDVIFQI